MTVAVSFERFLCVCYPFKFPKQKRKASLYIGVVLLFSLASHLPKFFAVEHVWPDQLEGNLSSSEQELLLIPTALLFSESYIRIYRTYLTIFTLILPVLLLVFLNASIIWTVKFSRTKQFSSAKRMRKEMKLCLVLFSIVAAFFLLHLPHIIVDIHEAFNVDNIVNCYDQGKAFKFPLYFDLLVHVSHVATILNSSINFVIYCVLGQSFNMELRRAIS